MIDENFVVKENLFEIKVEKTRQKNFWKSERKKDNKETGQNKSVYSQCKKHYSR
jgi:hypothetical protein